MRNKRNLIQEIKRINSINLGKEIITEQEGPILDLITALVRRGSNDKQTQSLITKVSETQAKGKRISLLSQLRKSQDIEISRLVKSMDNDLLQELETIIPRLTNNKSVQTRIIQDIQNGVSKEDSINYILRRFQKTYGDYANEFVNEFSSSVGKTYDDISAKINPPTPPKPDPNKPEPPIPSPTDYISIIRKFFRDLLSKKPELQTNLKTFQISASEKVNRIKALVEEYAQTKIGDRLIEINEEVRKIMVELGQEDKKLVGIINLEIENGLKNSSKAESKKWELLAAAMKKIKEDGGDFTYIEKISSPLSDFWVTIREGLKYGLAMDRNFFLWYAKTIATWFPNLTSGIKALRQIQGVKADDLPFVEGPFTGPKSLFVTSTFPGSMRGIPAGAPRQEIIKVGDVIKSKKDLPSGYQAIYDLQKNSKTKAWASLAIEKITKVIKYQVYFGVLNALKSWVLFLYQTDEEFQMEYRDCIKQVGDAMERGDISLDEVPNPEKIPSCLVEIEMGDQEVFNFPGSSYLFSFTNGWLGRESYTKQELIQAILIRAYLFRGAEKKEFALGFYNFFVRPMIPPMTEATLAEVGLGFFFGYAPTWAYEIATNYAPKSWSRLVTGGSTEVSEALKKLRIQAIEAAEELEQDMGLEIPVQLEETEYTGPDFDQ